MKRKLNDYVRGVTDYTSIVNYTRYDNNLYDGLGEYVYNDVFNKTLPEELDFINIGSRVINKQFYNFLSIILLSRRTLVIDKLKEIYGEPIYHNEFGEGFEGEYDEETDTELEPEIKELCASYFISINNTDYHISYDNRGVSVEVKSGTNLNDVINSLKHYLTLIYKQDGLS